MLILCVLGTAGCRRGVAGRLTTPVMHVGVFVCCVNVGRGLYLEGQASLHWGKIDFC